MEILIIVVQLVVGVLGLHFGANWLVSGSSKLALTFGIKPLVIGLTVVAMGTSAPELTVSLAGAFQGNTDLAVGNVVGSNIANIGLILGISATIKPMQIESDVFKRDLPFMLAATFLLVLAAYFGGPRQGADGGAAFMLGRVEGVILLSGMAFFIWFMLRGSRSAGGTATKSRKGTRRWMVALTIIGLGVLLIGGKLFVDGAVSAAQMLGVPELVIGLTVVAVGTSLPELATSIVAILKGESAISVGNVVGSNIFNIFLVLGIVSLIHPLPINVKVMQLDMIVMVAISVWVTGMAWRAKGLNRLHGVSLLAFYGIYVANLFFGWV